MAAAILWSPKSKIAPKSSRVSHPEWLVGYHVVLKTGTTVTIKAGTRDSGLSGETSQTSRKILSEQLIKKKHS